MEKEPKSHGRVIFGALLLVAAAAVILANVSTSPARLEPGGSGEYYVERVVDGDTIVCGGIGKVRLLGIDTPERGEAGFDEARDRLIRLVGGRWVTLYFDEVVFDKYGRVLGYPVVDGVEVCPLLVYEGLAVPYFIPPNERFRDRIEAAARGEEPAGLVLD
ncbi:MAG TPA: thermonuclease family protein [bacterium]|nr:thermonuclease family protein [bacterium]